MSGGKLCQIAAASEGNLRAITFNSGDAQAGRCIRSPTPRSISRACASTAPAPTMRWSAARPTTRSRSPKTRERVLGLGGGDKVTVKSGNHTCVDAASGNDTVKAGKAPVRVYGGAGNDKITAGNGNDVVYGAGGQDVIKAGNGKDSLNGGAGNDTVTAGNGADRLYGNAGADKLTAGTGRDYLFGAAGNDTLTARGTLAYVNGGKGHNVAYVKRPMASFARKHGTKTVHII